MEKRTVEEMEEKRRSLYVYPEDIMSNEYLLNLKSLLTAAGFEVKGISEFRNDKDKKESTVLFSWIEDRVCRRHWRFSTQRFREALLALLAAKFSGAKIVWIKHNYKPHDFNEVPLISKVYYRIMLFLIKRFSEVKLVHSSRFAEINNKYDYIPHPLYKVTESSNEMPRDIPFLIFGKLMKYKQIDRVLEHWPQGAPLLIAGKPESVKYENTIKGIIAKRELTKVTFNANFISNEELDQLLKRTSCVVVSNKGQSMLASGVVIHALSYRCSILATENNFTKELVEAGLPINLLPDFTAITREINQVKPVTSEHSRLIEKLYGNDAIIEKLKSFV